MKKSDEYKGVLYESTLRLPEIIKLCKTHTITHFKQRTIWGFWLRGGGIEAVAPYLFTSDLQHLDLSEDSILDKGAISIAKALKQSPSLTYLNISGNGISTVGMGAIVDALSGSNISNLTFCFSLFDDSLDVIPKLLNYPGLARLEVQSFQNGRYRQQDPGSSTRYLEQLLRVLKTNVTLQELVVSAGRDLTQAVDDCFDVNTTIVKGSGPHGITRHIVINQVCNELGATESELRSVPKWMDNREDIKQLLKELMRMGIQMNSLKLAFLGNGEVGKTTLLNAIRAAQDKERKKNRWFYQKILGFLFPSRTVGIDQSILIIKNGELSVWDFGGQLEYLITHQLSLSNEMVVYILCYDLSQPPNVQMQQVSYWLDFLSSALDLSGPQSAQSKWRVLIVGTKLDKSDVDPHENQDDVIQGWKVKWPLLPIHAEHFMVSSHNSTGVDQVLATIEEVCKSIFERHNRIPQPFKLLLESIRDIPEEHSIVPTAQISQQYSHGMSAELFSLAVKYLHAIGQLVILKGGLICTSPKRIPQLAARFVSPVDVRKRVATDTERVEILEEQQIGMVLQIHDNNKYDKHPLPLLTSLRLRSELHVLETIGVCFRLEEKAFLFPSLSEKAAEIKLSTDNPNFRLHSMRFTAPTGTIFVPGFFCQLIVALFEKLNVSMDGLFVGELLLAIEDNAKSIVALIKATNPDLSIVNDVFSQVTRIHSPQYQSSTRNFLCPTCVELSYFCKPPKFPHHEVGHIKHKDTAPSADEYSNNEEDSVVCKPRLHIIENFRKPASTKKGQETTLWIPLNTKLCWSHHRPKHHFFLNYRVATDGKKLSALSSEDKFGLVEVIYRKMATLKKKNGKYIFVFWDKMCLNYGQNWEKGFLHGLKSAKVILLLVSHKVIEGIAKNAPARQDNVLLEYPSRKYTHLYTTLIFSKYECAILLNELVGTPVLPIFAAGLEEDGTFKRFEYGKAAELLPEVPHKRKDGAQQVIDELSETLEAPKKSFVHSIKATVEKLFNMQGIHLSKRGEDPSELQALADLAMKTLNWVSVAKPKTTTTTSC